MKFLSQALQRVLCALVLFSTAQTLYGQSQITTGTIAGNIVDPTGASVPGAKVLLRNVDQGSERTVVTDAEGRFIAPLLAVGRYDITVTAQGFATVVQRGFVLTLGQSATFNVALQPATVQETITITAEAPLVETGRTDTSTLVDMRSVQNLPLNGRKFMDLAFLTPGVHQECERDGVSFAGQRGINGSINIDGADFNQPFFGGQRGGERSGEAFVVSQEAIREFQVVRSGFAPEFGRSTGGMMNVITRSGTNDFHGSAFYYLRHREFAPRNVWDEDTAPTRHQFGGAIGGPLVKDKTFFFTVWDQQEQEQAQVIRFNNIAGLPADLLARQGVSSSTSDVKTYLAKIDHQLTAGTRLIGRYNWSSNNALNGTFGGRVTTGVSENNGTEKDSTHTIVMNVNSVLTPSVLNELRGQYSYESRPRQNNGEGMDFNPVTGPQVQVSGCCFFGGVSFLPIVQDDDRIQIADNFSIIKGGHNLKIGFDYNRAHVAQIFRGNWRGVYVFNTIQNFVNVRNKVPGAVPDQFRIFFGSGEFEVATNEVAAFAQDSWRITPRLTLTGGLRWEGVWYPQPNAPNPLLPESRQIPNDPTEWQPRLGLSYDLFGTGKTVFRAASGIYYGRTPMLLLNQAFNSAGNPDVGVTFTLNPAQIRQVQAARPDFVFPFVPDTSRAQNSVYFTGAGVAGLRPDASFFSPDFKNPRSVNFSAGLEQLVATNLAVSLEWVRLSTTNLERIRDVNLFPPTPGLDNSNPRQIRPLFNTSTRPNPNFGILRSQQSSARSMYDALTLQLNKRYSRRFQFITSYTMAWNRDDDSNERNFAGIAYEDAFDLRREYTWSRNDIRHRWSFGGTYDLPAGFVVSGIMSWRSGLPFSAFTGTDSNGDRQFTDKPIVNGAHFGRNQFRNEDSFSNDLRVSKRFRFFESHELTFAADMFNFLNTEQFFYSTSSNESSTTALGSRWGPGQTPLATFRTIHLPDGTLNRAGISVDSPFQLQLSLKYMF
ncbi:MAG: TonB-dependent receptor [Acidobacteria bacterium]|nr:TonB-dependent receptor [Acidobacteriota bacterium]